jgi:hypothetical protein
MCFLRQEIPIQASKHLLVEVLVPEMQQKLPVRPLTPDNPKVS